MASMTLAATIVDDSANLSALTANNIRAVHILRLPFRLRLGMFHRFRYDDNTELFFRNHVDLPAGSTPLDAVRHPLLQGKDYESLFTEAMIIVRNLPLDIQTVAAIAEQLKQDRTKAVRCDHKSFAALKALNDFIVAYHTVTKTLFGGTPLGRLSDIEFFDRLLWEITLISPAETDITTEDALQLLNTQSRHTYTKLGGQLSGDLDDVPEGVISGLQRALELKEQYIFYEVAFDAKSRMVRRDFLGGLLYAVVALEAAHGAFLYLGIAERFKDVADEEMRAKMVEKHVSTLLREAGLSALYQLTPRLFMNEPERPSPQDLIECDRGIEMRNAIMHSSTKRGKYKIRNVTNNDVSQAYSAVLRVYESYRAAIENRLEAAPDNTRPVD